MEDAFLAFQPTGELLVDEMDCGVYPDDPGVEEERSRWALLTERGGQAELAFATEDYVHGGPGAWGAGSVQD